MVASPAVPHDRYMDERGSSDPVTPELVEPVLRVLVVGELSDSLICDVYRTRMFVEPLRRLGIDVRYASAALHDDRPLGSREVEQQASEGVDRLAAEVDRADVLVFRRAYATHSVCFDCEFATLDHEQAIGHHRATKHTFQIGRDPAVRRLFDRLEADVGAARRVAIVYETDDDWLRPDPANGYERIFRHERDLVERMIRRADLVTVSTPVLAARVRHEASEVRVIRNAIEPEWYGGATAQRQGRPNEDQAAARVLYYGSMARLRDYALCAPAVDEAAAAGSATRVWFGAPGLPDQVARVAPMFDEIHPYVAGVPAFARYLRGLEPAIGLAPLLDSPFARAKSELHWLEYSMAGAVTVASRLRGDGPYDVIRHGIDGFKVSTPYEWRETLICLASSADLRAAVAAQARARVLEEYDVTRRALEWAQAYRLAATVAGRGLPSGRRTGQVRSGRENSPARRAGNRAARRARDRDGFAMGGMKPAAPAAGASTGDAPSPETIFAAYVAAQAFAGRSPLRLRLGLDGSAARGEAGSDQEAEAWVTIDSAGDPDLRHNIAFGLPFADGAVEAIDARLVLDGLGGMAPVLAQEAARVLRRGGRFRLVTADRAAALARQGELALQGVLLSGSDARLPAFSAGTLDGLLRGAGFSDIVLDPGGPGEIVASASR